MAKAKDVMTTNVFSVSQDTALIDAIILLIEKNIAGVPIVDKGNNLKGIITEKDMMDLLNKGKVTSSMRVSDFSSIKVNVVNPNDDLTKVSKIFMENSYRMVPVCEGAKLVGVISRRDIIKTVLSTAFGVDVD
jgi:CBS domain-containing protein